MTTRPASTRRAGSLRATLRDQVLLGLLLLLGFAGAGLAFFLRNLLCTAFDDGLAVQARLLRAFVEEELSESPKLDLSEATLPEFQPGQDPRYLEVTLDGVPAARSPSLGAQGFQSQELAQTLRRMGRRANLGFLDLPLPDGRRGRAAVIGFEAPDGGGGDEKSSARHQWVQLTVARERVSLDRTLLALWLGLATLAGVLLLVVPVIVVRATRTALRPLERFADEVAKIGAQTLGGGVGKVNEVPQELQPVAAKLNALLERLHESFARERRFTADVAHELRTPLSELRTIAEVALRFPEKGSRASAFEDVRDATLQMERLIEALRNLARAEGGTQTVRDASVDLSEMVSRCWKPVAAAAQQKGLSVASEVAPGLLVQTDAALITSVVGNLFSNALAYTSAGGFVRCSARWDEDAVAVTVTNSNEGLTAEDVAHVFEPFWRKDAARTGGLHAGIGLTLARAFALLLSADLSLRLDAPDIVCAELRVPRRPPRHRPSIQSS